MKKIYFACSIAGGRDYAFVYKDVVEVIKKCDVKVTGELFADPTLEPGRGAGVGSTPSEVWERDTVWLNEADAVISEATKPSLGVGYQIARAEAMKKPILVLFYKKSVESFSWMISGSPKIKTVEYAEYAEAKKAIKEFIAGLS